LTKETGDHYPVAIVQDRYAGIYSNGIWLAVAQADQKCEGQSRVDFILSDQSRGPHGDDTEAMRFWADPPEWIAVGNSPQEALDHLLRGTKAERFRLKPRK
jgi:hypothetical protein